MALDAAQASTLFAAHMGTLPEGSTTFVRPVDGHEGFWSAGVVNRLGMIEPGAFYIVAPDGRIWIGSSNPGIHDRELAMQILGRLYDADLADVVDQDLVMQRVEQLTRGRTDTIAAVVAAARAGELKARSHRRLP